MSTSAPRAAVCARCHSEYAAASSRCPFCGHSHSAPTTVGGVRPEELSDLEIARSALGEEYEILDELGRGGMAIVYHARERQLDREVALKVLPLSLAFDGEFVERFQQEARTAAQLEHPHIVPIYRVGRAGHVIHFVMKYLRAGSLSAVLRARAPLPVDEIRRLLIEVGGALDYASKRGVVHRDIKPDNVMLDEAGRFVVTDFGIAKSASGRQLTAAGMSVGTPRYMSPEQARAKPVDGRSDIYSLGVVAYECLTGHVPFDADDQFAILLDHIHAPVPRPELPTAAHAELYAVIERMLHKDPEHRIQNGAELLEVVGGHAALRPMRPAEPGAADGMIRLTIPVSREQAGRALAAARMHAEVLAGNASEKLDEAVSWAQPHVDVLRARARAVGSKASAHPRVRWVAASRTRLMTLAGAAAVALVGGYYAAHFALMHRSQCPSPAPATVSAALSSRSSPFSVLLDPVKTQREGGELDVYYDLCGAEPGADYEAKVVVTKRDGGLRRLLSGTPSTSQSFDERAKAPAIRRHRTVELGELPPGSYTLDLIVTDANGRRRQKAHTFRIVQ